MSLQLKAPYQMLPSVIWNVKVNLFGGITTQFEGVYNDSKRHLKPLILQIS